MTSGRSLSPTRTRTTSTAGGRRRVGRLPEPRSALRPTSGACAVQQEERLSRFRQSRLPLADGFQLSPAVATIQAIGHEVGHTAFEVASAGETLLIWGDVVHVPSIQFARPELAWEFDADQDQARSTRQSMLERATNPVPTSPVPISIFPASARSLHPREAFATSRYRRPRAMAFWNEAEYAREGRHLCLRGSAWSAT